MKTTSEYLRLLKQFKETKGASYGIQKIGLFGSVARGEQKISHSQLLKNEA